MLGRRIRAADPFEGHPSHHFKSTRVRDSGMLVSVDPVGFLQDWGFGDFQSLRLSPGEHPIQRIGASHLKPDQRLAQGTHQRGDGGPKPHDEFKVQQNGDRLVLRHKLTRQLQHHAARYTPLRWSIALGQGTYAQFIKGRSLAWMCLSRCLISWLRLST